MGCCSTEIELLNLILIVTVHFQYCLSPTLHALLLRTFITLTLINLLSLLHPNNNTLKQIPDRLIFDPPITNAASYAQQACTRGKQFHFIFSCTAFASLHSLGATLSPFTLPPALLYMGCLRPGRPRESKQLWRSN